MVLCDVSVLLHALFAQSQEHARCKKELDRLVASGEDFGVSDQVLAAVLRVGTNPKVFRPPAKVADVFRFVNALLNHRHAVMIRPAQRHWQIFQDLVETSDVVAGDTTDAWYAALAIEHGCEWWTTDAHFGRFPGLRQRNLLSR